MIYHITLFAKENRKLRKVTKFVSFDGKEFDTSAECIKYEEAGIDEQIESMHRRVQQSKACMSGVNERYEKCLARYRRACTSKKMAGTDKLEAFELYLNAKAHLKRYVEEYTDLKKVYKELKSKKTKILEDLSKK